MIATSTHIRSTGEIVTVCAELWTLTKPALNSNNLTSDTLAIMLPRTIHVHVYGTYICRYPSVQTMPMAVLMAYFCLK